MPGARWSRLDVDAGADLERLQRSVNKMLAPSVAVREAAWAPPGFDARRSALSRTYRYSLSVRPVAGPVLGRSRPGTSVRASTFGPCRRRATPSWASTTSRRSATPLSAGRARWSGGCCGPIGPIWAKGATCSRSRPRRFATRWSAPSSVRSSRWALGRRKAGEMAVRRGGPGQGRGRAGGAPARAVLVGGEVLGRGRLAGPGTTPNWAGWVPERPSPA